VYDRLRPDILVVLGDRFEILSAVASALPFRIPVAHIHGGEATEGLIDEQIRHAVTKMSHLHFPATEPYRQRILQMGEPSSNVFCFGAPGLDNIRRLPLLTRDVLFKELGLPEEARDLGVVTYHPVTLEKDSAQDHISNLLDALQPFSEVFWVFTLPNPDTGSRSIAQRIEHFVATHPDMAKLFASLGSINYLSLLRCASLMVGNSSSGLIEAPSFALPVVNIGDRQRGRVRAQNIVDVESPKSQAIRQAINRVLSPAFRASLRGMENPYGDGSASDRIVAILKTVELNEGLIKKSFKARLA
jgi:UDP-hydrolysing UDP-N-acetyl-D-glucosamine 2-epimerase